MKLFQVKFVDGSYSQIEAKSFADVEKLLGTESIASIVILEMMTVK